MQEEMRSLGLKAESKQALSVLEFIREVKSTFWGHGAFAEVVRVPWIICLLWRRLSRAGKEEQTQAELKGAALEWAQQK